VLDFIGFNGGLGVGCGDLGVVRNVVKCLKNKGSTEGCIEVMLVDFWYWTRKNQVKT
jgi:hypothetical protein